MARRKWKAGPYGRRVQEPFLRRFRIPIAIAALVVVLIGVFIYKFINSDYQYGDPETAYHRALADCMRDRTRYVDSGDAVDRAAADCVRDTPGGF
jgi:hypothetical protein